MKYWLLKPVTAIKCSSNQFLVDNGRAINVGDWIVSDFLHDHMYLIQNDSSNRLVPYFELNDKDKCFCYICNKSHNDVKTMVKTENIDEQGLLVIKAICDECIKDFYNMLVNAPKDSSTE